MANPGSPSSSASEPTFRYWNVKEIKQASELWKQGIPVKEIADQIGRSERSLKYQVMTRRDWFPHRRRENRNRKDYKIIKIEVTPFLHKTIKEEAKKRNTSMNLVIEEGLLDRFVRKRWKPQASTSIEKVKYSNGSKEL